jgi:hypothetical protein
MTHPSNDDQDRFLHDIETPVEHAGRRYSEDALRYATIESVSALTSNITTLTSTVNMLTTTVNTMREEQIEMRSWMVGTISPEGKPIIGVLGVVAGFNSFKMWALALLGASATGITVNLLLHIVDLVHGTHPN